MGYFLKVGVWPTSKYQSFDLHARETFLIGKKSHVQPLEKSVNFAVYVTLLPERQNSHNWQSSEKTSWHLRILKFLTQYSKLKSHSSALLISRYILRLGQLGRCCFRAACPNRKMYLEIRSPDEGLLSPSENIGCIRSWKEKQLCQCYGRQVAKIHRSQTYLNFCLQ